MGGASITRVDGGRIIEVKHTSIRNMGSKKGRGLFSTGAYFWESTETNVYIQFIQWHDKSLS